MRIRVILSCIILLLITSSLSMSLSGANFLFDLNGVLVTQSGAWWEIGPWNFVGLYNFSSIQKNYFEFLESIEPHKMGTPALMHDNKLLPQIMYEWLAGNYTSTQVLTKIDEKLLEKTISKRKRSLFKAIASYMFTPHRFAKTIVPIKAGKKLFEKCRKAKNTDGSNKHKIYLISNWDAESFPYLLHNEEIRSIIAQADGIIISGLVHRVKPDPEIFMLTFEKFKIDPDKELTIYIDDEKVNIEAAQSLGKKKLLSIHCKDSHFDLVKKAFKQLQIT